MLIWTVLGGIAVFTGSVTGRSSWLAVLVATLWAFVAGLAVSVSTRAGDLGLNTLVTVIVFSARGAMPAAGAAEAGLLVVAGGLFQAVLSLLFWPLRRYEHERAAVGLVYRTLAKELDPEHPEGLQTPLQSPTQQVQDVLASLGTDQSLEGYRLRLLFDQADRLRISTFVLESLRSELTSDARKENAEAQKLASDVDQLLRVSSSLLSNVGDHLTVNDDLVGAEELLKELQDVVDKAHREGEADTFSLANEVAAAVDVLAGQLRAVTRLASHATTTGETEFALEEAEHPWRLQVQSWIGTVRANLDFRSTYFRHAVRLAVCVCLSDIIARYIAWQRTYWLPMTAAVLLKPDFTTTISRGVLRLAGTYGGLLLATGLYHALPPSALSELVLVGAFTFLLRSFGPANYGVFSLAISGLIVFLIAETGVSPADVVSERALNTTAGGCFALAVYALWPTWERTQVDEAIAAMLDTTRAYFHGVVQRFGEGSMPASTLDQLRGNWRRTRSDAEGSVSRIESEPGTDAAKLNCLTSILASSQTVVHSVMSMEAAAIQGTTQTPEETFRRFSNDVEFTLYYLAETLRGSKEAFKTLPKLREDYRRMIEARNKFAVNDEFLILTADQLTVTLNTLREQVMKYRTSPSAAEVSAAKSAMLTRG